MTDIFAVSAKVVSNLSLRKRGINIDTVLKRPISEWNKEGINTGYFRSIPTARLAIAAFSNYPNPQYQNIIDRGGSIFSTTKTDTNVDVKINDFLYGCMCDPIYIAEEYDRISGKSGSYFQLCQLFDRIVDDFAYKRLVSNQDIKAVIQKLDTFAKLRSLVKTQEGVFSLQYADEIYKEFLKIKVMVEKEYGFEEKQKRYKGPDLGKAGLGASTLSCDKVQEELKNSRKNSRNKEQGEE